MTSLRSVFIFLIPFLFVIESSQSFAGPGAAGGGDSIGGHSHEVLVRTETLLRANNHARRALLNDYRTLRTDDGFYPYLTRMFVEALLVDESYIRQLIRKVERYRSAKLRKQVLDREYEALVRKQDLVSKQLSQDRFKNLLNYYYTLEMIPDFYSSEFDSTPDQREYLRLRREASRLDALLDFVLRWSIEPHSGPGGTRTVSR